MKATGTRIFETGFTPAGQMYVKTTTERGSVIKTTRDPAQFVRLIFNIPMGAAYRSPQPESYKCECCGMPFTKGMRIAGLSFSQVCVDDGFHYKYFREIHNMTDREIYNYTENDSTYL